MGNFINFISKWLAKSFARSFGIADIVAGVIGILFPVAAKFIWPELETDLKDLAWQIPLVVLIAIACVRIILALYWLWKEEWDRAEKAESALKMEQESQTLEIPSGHLQALSRYDATISDLGERQALIGRLIEQYKRLRDSSISNYQRFGGNVDFEELFQISELIFGQISRFTPDPPVEPRNGLTIVLDWNHFLVIFDVPMRIPPPKIQISDIPNDSHAEISNITKISFEVHFWPDKPKIETFGITTNARL